MVDFGGDDYTVVPVTDQFDGMGVTSWLWIIGADDGVGGLEVVVVPKIWLVSMVVEGVGTRWMR